jgi:hypothetical protein
MICITATEEKFSRKYLDGKWQALQNEAGNKGYEIKNGGLGKCFKFPASEVDLSMADFLELNDDGFTIHNWPCFLSLDAAKYSDPVPEESRIGSSQTTRATRRLKPGRSGDRQAMSI